MVASLVVVDGDLGCPGRGPSVHRQSRLRLRLPATGVSAQSLSSSEEEESRLSPVRGPLVLGDSFGIDLSVGERVGIEVGLVRECDEVLEVGE